MSKGIAIKTQEKAKLYIIMSKSEIHPHDDYADEKFRLNESLTQSTEKKKEIMNKVNINIRAKSNKQTTKKEEEKSDHEDKLTCCQKLAEPRDACIVVMYCCHSEENNLNCVCVCVFVCGISKFTAQQIHTNSHALQ